MSNRVYTQPNYLPVNECGIITIHPMSVDCIPIPNVTPSGTGSLLIKISGGTPPYQIIFPNPNGNIPTIPSLNAGQTLIQNLLPGTYFVQVTDNFGDFSILINCTIDESIVTPTTTIPLPPTPSYQEFLFCLRVKTTSNLGRVEQTIETFRTFYLNTFTSVNNTITPTYISETEDEIIFWDYTNSYWSLSANNSSFLVASFGNQSTWSIVNYTPLPTPPSNSYIPIGNWSFISQTYFNTDINTLGTFPCDTKRPSLSFYINESWWFYYNANIPNQYRGNSCGGDNETPWFKWNLINLTPPLSVVNYEILCVKTSTSDVYFDVSNIDSSQTEVSSTIPWIGTPIIGTTIGGFPAMNSEGWQGPCSPTNYTVTLTVNLSDSSTMTRTISFIYCNNITNGFCSI
jgi:hypothetical protein